MKITHRYNSEERQHFLLNDHHYFKLKPKLLYSGVLCNQKGWLDKAHVHKFAETMFVMDGKGKIFCNDKVYDIKKGDAIIYNAGVTHREKSDDKEPLHLLFVGLDKVDISELEYNHLIPDSYSIVYSSGDMELMFRTYFSLIVNEMAAKDKFYTEISKNAAITLVMYLYRLINRYNDVSHVMEHDKIYETVINYIELHFLEPITLADIAQACHISKSHLSHLFVKIKKQSVMQYILNKRLGYAKNLIETTNLKVEEIALSSGFNNSSYFSKVFKEVYKTTPMSVRKEGYDKKRLQQELLALVEK